MRFLFFEMMCTEHSVNTECEYFKQITDWGSFHIGVVVDISYIAFM